MNKPIGLQIRGCLVILFLLVGCSGPHDDRPPLGTKETVWQGCQERLAGSEMVSANLPNSASVRYAFKGSSFYFVGSALSFSHCEDSSTPVWRVEASGSYHLGAESTKFSGANDIDFVVGSLEVSVFEPSLIAELNQSRACGFSDWEEAKPKTIALDECRDIFTAGSGLLPHSIYRSVGATVFVGEARDPIDGLKPEDRPNHLGKTALRVDEHYY